MITEKGKEVEAEIPKNQHSIPHRSFEKVTWNRDVKGDTSRLPSMYHILFAILDESDVDFFISNIKKVGQSFKLIKNLGGFAICESEEKAAILFNELNSKLFVYPLKEVPKEIRNDQLRSEICFMEGVRPKKSTNIAERFIYSHLGFK